MEEKNKTFHRKKTVWAFVLCLAAFLGLTGRLVYLMVYQSSYYTQAAQELHQRERNIKAKRGRIIDATGTVLADNRTVCNISVIHNRLRIRTKWWRCFPGSWGLKRNMSESAWKNTPP